MNKVAENGKKILQWINENDIDFEKEIGMEKNEAIQIIENLLDSYLRNEKQYVIDASITGTENFREIFSKLHSKSSKIILTSITIRELDMIQHFRNDNSARNARNILSTAAKDENSEIFCCIQIPEDKELADDNIISYCNSNKNAVILATADKVMALKARMYGIQTEYYSCSNFCVRENVTAETDEDPNVVAETDEDPNVVAETDEDPNVVAETDEKPNESEMITLYGASIENGKLVFDLSYFNDTTHLAKVWKYGSVEFTKEKVVLDVGDDVLVSKLFREEENMTFAHYKIVDNTVAEKNCVLEFATRIYFSNPQNALKVIEKNKRYTSFIKDILSSEVK